MIVTPRAGVWIEIFLTNQICCDMMSLPVRECGLKLFCHDPNISLDVVTPRAGVWIEIDIIGPAGNRFESLPVRECGLKFLLFCFVVTPRAGVWIEIRCKRW